MVYDYECKSCHKRFEAINTIENRHKMKCVECDGECRKLIGNGKPPTLDVFTPGYWPHLDSKLVYIKNKKHLAEECRKRWTPTNKPWAEMLDGYGSPGPPPESFTHEEHQSKEEKCQKKGNRLMEKVEKARRAGRVTSS